MRRYRLVLSTILLVILGVSCSSLQTTPIPSPFPPDYFPTVIELTIQAGHTDEPTTTLVSTPADFPPVSPTPTSGEISSVLDATPTPLEFDVTTTSSPAPTLTSTPDLSATPNRRATRTPTITPTPPIPNARVQFVEPGPMSKVISPLHVIANLRSVPSGTYHVELWIEPLHEGEEPRLLYREVQRIISNPVDWVYVDEDLQFELSRVSEFGQLRASVFDTFGRPVSIGSVDLLLLSMGVSSITLSAGQSEPIVIHEPTKNQLITGGKVIVSGLAKPTEDFMLVELVAADGSVVGYRQVFVTPAPDGSYVPYAVEVPYQVDAPTWVRLCISESGTRITGMEHLSSVEVLVSP
jgi:hypothetical protein